MSTDPKITDTLMYGDRLCREQRTTVAWVWDDDWFACGDQSGHFGVLRAKCLAVQFRRRPGRNRHVVEPTTHTTGTVPLPVWPRVLEDA
jgi:hypothetical protein